MRAPPEKKRKQPSGFLGEKRCFYCLPVDESLVNPIACVGSDTETVPGLQLPSREEIVARIERYSSKGFASYISVPWDETE